MNNIFEINGKNTLITGITGDIGSAIASYFSNKNQNIFGIGRDSKKNKLKNINFYEIDMLNTDEIKNFAKSIDFSIDNLIFCHGIHGARPVRMLDDKFTDLVMKTNYSSTINLLSNLIRAKKINAPGRVVFVSSIAAHMGAKNNVVYAGAKSAVEASFRSIAKDYLKKNITFNSIAPAAIRTKLFQGNNDLQVLNESTYPLGIGQTEDIAYACEFLCAKGAKHITGETLILAGGATYLE